MATRDQTPGDAAADEGEPGAAPADAGAGPPAGHEAATTNAPGSTGLVAEGLPDPVSPEPDAGSGTAPTDGGANPAASHEAATASGPGPADLVADASPYPVSAGRDTTESGAATPPRREHVGTATLTPLAPTPPATGDLPPTLSDPAMHAGSEVLGGPAGSHRAVWSGFWTPIRIMLVAGTVTFWLGFLRTWPCMSNGWIDPDRYEAMCYSDIPVLYSLRGLADGYFPYLEWPASGQPWEYPVLIGLLVYVTGTITKLLTGGQADALTFYVVNAVAAYVFFMVTVWATAAYVRRRAWDGLMLALSPAVFLASFVNWDWPAVMLTALALLAWSRGRPGWAGIALGLAVAAKFYPLLLLGPLFLLCLRAGRLKAFGVTVLGAVGAWLVVNVPFIVTAFAGWKYFFTFSAERGQDFGSLWLALQTTGHGVPPTSVNTVATGVFVVLCGAIGLLILFAPTRPRLAQVSFLVVAAFLLTNKVYSPQFVLWLVPLAILARPRWRDIIWWQVAEAIYFAGVWWYLVGLTDGNKGLSEQWYAAAIMIHIVATAILAGIVVRDILLPQYDPVRSDGIPDHRDDPGGGVLDGAPDWGKEPEAVAVAAGGTATAST